MLNSKLRQSPVALLYHFVRKTSTETTQDVQFKTIKKRKGKCSHYHHQIQYLMN